MARVAEKAEVWDLGVARKLVNAYNLIVAAGGLVSCAHAGRRPHEEN